MINQLTQATNWEQRYRLLIQLGKTLSPPTAEQLLTMQEIKGCEAKLWFKIEEKTDRTFHFQAYSEARIMNGLLWLMLHHINGKTAQELKQFHLIEYFTQLGIAQRLTETRLNGIQQINQLIHQLD